MMLEQLDPQTQARPGAPTESGARRLPLRGRERELVQLLRAAPLFARTSPFLLQRLLDDAALQGFVAGQHIFLQGDPADGFYLIVQGAVRIVDESAESRLLTVLGPGEGFGEIALLQAGLRTASAVSAKPCELLLISRRSFEDLCRRSRAFSASVQSLMADRTQANQRRSDRRPEAVWLENRSRYDAPRLAGLLGQALLVQGCTRVAVMVLEDRSDTSSACHAGVQVTRLPASDSRGIEAQLAGETGAEYLLCLVDRGSGAASRSQGERLRSDCPTWLRLQQGSHFAPVDAGSLVHDVQILDGAPRRRGPPPLPARQAARRSSIRLRLGVGPDALPAELRAAPGSVRRALDRLARALMRRLVGVALSGGGAWGFAHCALLQGLHERGIPVDMIASSSFGSIVGPVYASQGVAGLSRLIDDGPWLSLIAASCMLSSWPAGQLVARRIPELDLEELEVVSLPVAVELQQGSETVFRRGPIAQAVRASCTFPGIFGPTVIDSRRYIDGCITNNVPVSCLLDEGADFVIASNIIPPPAKLRPEGRRGVLGRLVEQISPLARARDTLRSLLLLGHHLGQSQASSADALFSPELAPYLLTDFTQARGIVARAREQLPPFLERLERSYGTFTGV